MSRPFRSSSRTCSPRGVPPGSRVATTSCPPAHSASASSSAWVVFPEPSRPSNVTNTSNLRYGSVRAVVTGGAGFIGSHVVEKLLARGDEVHVLDNLATGKRENVPAAATVHQGDIRTDCDRLFAELEPDACFHYAAQADVRVSVDRPDFDADVNVIGTVRVLEAA